MSGICKVEECAREATKRGFCNRHYLRWRRHGDPLGGEGLREEQPRVCTVEGCSKRTEAKGFCSAHYSLYKKYGTPYKRRVKQFCKIEGCDGSVVGHGLCSKHYYREKRHGFLEATRDASGLPSKHPVEYRIYSSMKSRCYNPRQSHYEHYGGRGIKVCSRWLEKPQGFRNFLEDMGVRPSSKYSIDRIDVNGDYCAENCRWATKHEQMKNTTIQKARDLPVGVYFLKKYGCWQAKLQINGVTHTKRAKTLEKAILARKNLESRFLGN